MSLKELKRHFRGGIEISTMYLARISERASAE